MNRQRFTLLVIGACIAMGGAWYASMQRHATSQSSGVALLPGLANDMDRLVTVTVRKGATTPAVTLHKVQNQWSVAERGDYPADLTKMRKLLTALRDARIVEEKTADPKRFAVLGVEDPGDPAATGIEIAVSTPAARYGLIVGKPVGAGNFVRRLAEKRSYSVEPSISVETEPRFWIEPSLVDVPATLILNIDVRPAAGLAYRLHRLNPADNSFTLDGVPAGRKALEGPALTPAPSLLAALNAEDVALGTAVDFSHASEVIVTLTDGTVLTLTGTILDKRHWIEIGSSKQSALTAKAEGRAFEIAGYRFDALFKTIDQFLEPASRPAHAPTAAP